MDGGVRETLCSSCSHRNVCAHKDDYLNMVKSLQEMFYKFHSKELSTPKFLTQRMAIPENSDAKSCAKMIV